MESINTTENGSNSTANTGAGQGQAPKLQLDDKDILNLHFQEYTALRAEQRTRLDSANKIIHYSAVVMAAVVVGLLSLYKSADHTTFMATFRVVLLLVPVVILPFAFTQQNEEIFVRHIGSYLDDLKNSITEKSDSRYWAWESFHTGKQPSVLILTSFFRAGLLIIFSVLALCSYYAFFGVPRPIAWFERVRSLTKLEVALGALQSLDLLLNLVAISVGIWMYTRSRKGSFLPQKKEIGGSA